MTDDLYDHDQDAAALRAQLSSELQASLRSSAGILRGSPSDRRRQRRPILTHLNADTSWLLSLPRPTQGYAVSDLDLASRDHSGDDNRGESSQGNSYYHILIDPWFRGGQSDVAPFFSQQFHAQPSAVQSVGEVETLIRRIEAGTQSREQNQELGSQDRTTTNVPFTYLRKREEKEEAKQSSSTEIGGAGINAIIISHEFTDHMHKPTLLEASPTIPILAPSAAAAIIRSWAHFTHIATIDPLRPESWPSPATASMDGGGDVPPLLPPWLSITRLVPPGKDLLYYHTAIMVAFGGVGAAARRDAEPASFPPLPSAIEAIIYTPHGIPPAHLASLSTLITRSPAHARIHPLALLHGLDDIALPGGAQLNLGAHNALAVQEILQAPYWVGTHDEMKIGKGLVSWFLRRRVLTPPWEGEGRGVKGDGQDGEEGDIGWGDCFVGLENGESLVLE